MSPQRLPSLDALIDSASDAIWTVDDRGRITAWNSSAERILGRAAADVLDRRFEELGFGARFESAVAEALEGRATPVLEVPAPSGLARRTLSVAVSPLSGSHERPGASVVARPLPERDPADARGSSRDPLTGLLDRAALHTRLAWALDGGAREPLRALLIVDLDGFHAVNDALGPEAGDAGLVEVARRLEDETRDSDVVARMGGDEFAVLVADLDAPEGRRVASDVVEALTRPEAVTIDGRSCVLAASVGMALARPGTAPSALLQSADVALQAAKARGGGHHEVFDPDEHADILDRRQLELDLTLAPTRGELVLHYQPVVDLVSGDVPAVEALVRWHHPERGLLEPGAFIPLAEESGAIVAVGRWVLDEACRQLAAWRSNGGLPELEVSVNLSTRQLRRPDLFDDVSEILFRHGLEPSSLTLEVTETAVMTEPDASLNTLEKLEALGVGLALDDFGTGYSSLSYLRRLPTHTVKVDRAFVDGIAREPAEWSLAAAIVKLARSLKKNTLAEGVEEPGQLAHLRSLGCERAQGFLFARPLEPVDVAPWIASHREEKPV